MPTTYRIEKVSIDTPKPNEEPFFQVVLQKVVCDGEKVIETVSRADVLVIRETDLATDEVDIHDPITDLDIHISGDGVWLSLLEVLKDMVAARLNYDLNEDRELVRR